MPGDPQILSATTHELRVQFEQPTMIHKFANIANGVSAKIINATTSWSKFTDKSPLLWVAAM